MNVSFTPREVSELSGTPRWTVEKAIEQGVLTPAHARLRRHRRQRLLPLYAIAYVRVIDGIDLGLSKPMKKRLADGLSKLDVQAFANARIEITPAVELDLGRLVGDAMTRAHAYGLARDALIVEDGEAPGGERVIKGVGVSVYALASRALKARRLADLRNEYPDLPEGAIEAAQIYARAHPRLGRRPA
ncbi:MAG: hypothetical protein P4L73_09840 [Caulobacteraceae bacterium]|nr:hypothetical protein [Caulobacteraceae bacterium]